MAACEEATPSNKPLEWSGHRKFTFGTRYFLPATQGQRSKDVALLNGISKEALHLGRHPAPSREPVIQAESKECTQHFGLGCTRPRRGYKKVVKGPSASWLAPRKNLRILDSKIMTVI